MVNIFWRKTFW